MKRILTLLIILLACIFTLSAKNKENALTLNLYPYAYQKINYTSNEPPIRRSVFGTGAGLSFYFGVEENVSIGTEVSYEFHRFKGFHDYHDLKVNARIKNLFLPLNEEETVKLNYSLGLGSDFVFRDDSDFGCYMMMVIAGTELEWRAFENMAVKTGLDCTFSFQDGSYLFHLTPQISCTWYFDREGE